MMKPGSILPLAGALFLGALLLVLCTGCVTEHGSATPGYYKPGLPGDPASRFGIFIEGPQPVIIVPEK